MNGPNNIEDEKDLNSREPIFNLPNVILFLAAAMILVHLWLNYLATANDQFAVKVIFAFNPAYFATVLQQASFNNGAYYFIWSPITHAFLHADWTHLLLNLGFMVAFGAPVARRIGNIRFLILFVLSAVGGVFMFWIMNQQKEVFLIGASGAVSGFMGAASRFAFQPNVDEFGNRQTGLNVFGPALTLFECIQDRRFLNFFTIWMVMNILFGTVFSSVLGGSGNIAWEAHIGGFIAGILAFSMLDRSNLS